VLFFFASRRRHTMSKRDWSSDVCSSDLAEYKGTRKPMAEELRQQVPVIKEVLQAMNIEIIEKEGLEADDLLGTISCMCEEKGLRSEERRVGEEGREAVWG